MFLCSAVSGCAVREPSQDKVSVRGPYETFGHGLVSLVVDLSRRFCIKRDGLVTDIRGLDDRVAGARSAAVPGTGGAT